MKTSLKIIPPQKDIPGDIYENPEKGMPITRLIII